MQLRPYQQEAVDAALVALEAGSNPVLQLATGTGKSLIIAALAEHYRATNRQVWMITHVQQLVKQNAATYERYAGIEPAIVCASLGRRDTWGGVTYGTIQSVTGMLDKLIAPDLIIIDEAHRVPHNEGEPSQYEVLLSRYPWVGRVAMTATPWRMDNGVIHGEGKQFWFDTLAYNYTVQRAVADGWLCPLVGVETAVQLNVQKIAIKGDFIQSQVEAAQTEAWLKSVARSMLKLAEKRQHIGVYCPTVKAVNKTAEIIREVTEWSVSVLHSGMSSDERQAALSDFMSGAVRVLCSVDMITTGFDFPAMDCIVCLRPTLSSSLWVQIQGRGTRLHPDKKNCLILDYAGNLIRLGGVDMYENFYREKGLEVVYIAGPYSSTDAPKDAPTEQKIYSGVNTLLAIDPMTGQAVLTESIVKVDVQSVSAVAITPKGKDVAVLLVHYACTTTEGVSIKASSFIDTENPTYKTHQFFFNRGLAVALPSSAKSLSWQIKGAQMPDTVVVRKKGQYWNVIEEHF
jgi:DNA repair protein RadD